MHLNLRSLRIGAALAAAAALAAVATAPLAAARVRPPIRPVLGDWEGTGPHGLGLSFEFVRRGRHVVVLDYALGLPTGCRSTGGQTWDAEFIPHIAYIPPGQVLHGPFPPLGPTQFELIIAPSAKQPFPVIMDGRFSSPHRGVISIPSPTRFGCTHTGWPRTLRFSLAAAHRVPVADGTWTGTVAGPPAGTAGTVKIRVIDGGRIETDFSTSYSCPPPNAGIGSFEIGPLASVGYLIEANGSIGGAEGTEMQWSGRFAASGLLSGKIIVSDCVPLTDHPTFSARLNGT